MPRAGEAAHTAGPVRKNRPKAPSIGVPYIQTVRRGTWTPLHPRCILPSGTEPLTARPCVRAQGSLRVRRVYARRDESSRPPITRHRLTASRMGRGDSRHPGKRHDAAVGDIPIIIHIVWAKNHACRLIRCIAAEPYLPRTSSQTRPGMHRSARKAQPCSKRSCAS